ncbi:hypothetical protein F4824DRAFT_484670 [Ustulina deusta]|nr:hypothetical protein F4824DRAFT_484670 [Ustulina deusta]
MANQLFRVIIVSAGPVGLCLAHALSLAYIDFVIPEQRSSIVFQGGAGILLWPHSARLLDQLGMLEYVQELSSALHSKAELLANGHIIASYPIWEKIERKHIHLFSTLCNITPISPISIRELVQCLRNACS